MKGIAIDELPPEARAKALAAMGRKPLRKRIGASMEQIRSRAIQALESCADMTQSDRRRVLKKALEMNEV